MIVWRGERPEGRGVRVVHEPPACGEGCLDPRLRLIGGHENVEVGSTPGGHVPRDRVERELRPAAQGIHGIPLTECLIAKGGKEERPHIGFGVLRNVEPDRLRERRVCDQAALCCCRHGGRELRCCGRDPLGTTVGNANHHALWPYIDVRQDAELLRELDDRGEEPGGLGERRCREDGLRPSGGDPPVTHPQRLMQRGRRACLGFAQRLSLRLLLRPSSDQHLAAGNRVAANLLRSPDIGVVCSDGSRVMDSGKADPRAMG